MLKFRNWAKWQLNWRNEKSGSAARMRKLRAKAKGLNVEDDDESATRRSFTMTFVVVANALDSDFYRFAEAVGGVGAETYLVRSLQYAGLHSAAEGIIAVPRRLFGRIVLTRPWDLVDDELGGVVFDALIRFGICVPIEPTSPVTSPRASPVTNSVTSPRASPVRDSRPALPCLVQSSPDTPAVPDVTPSVTANGHDGGDSPSAPPAERNGHGPEPLSPDDLGVFEMLWRRREKLLNADATECERLVVGLREKSPDADAIRAFVERLTPSNVDEVTKVRRAFRMAANGRRPRK